jgi:hypothetical protein
MLMEWRDNEFMQNFSKGIFWKKRLIGNPIRKWESNTEVALRKIAFSRIVGGWNVLRYQRP